MAVFHLHTPLSESDVRAVRAGDTLYLGGDVFTGRSRIHRYVFDEGNPLPFDTQKQNAMIHVGPIIIMENDAWKLVSFMPTSSLRFEKWGAAAVKTWGLRVIVGKTTMGRDTMRAMHEYGCIHASPQCVGPNLWQDAITIRSVELLDELGSIEAAWQLTVRELGPFLVDIDAQGGNYFDALDDTIAEHRIKVYEDLGIPAGFQETKLYGRY